jgi:hypothetical protein
VTHGSATLHIETPARRSDKTIERAVRAARRAAFPEAVATARAEAEAMARAAGLRLAKPIGVSRDASPIGYWDPDAGRFGTGRWCGPVTHRRDDGRRVTRRECPIPRGQTVRLTVTFATR